MDRPFDDETREVGARDARAEQRAARQEASADAVSARRELPEMRTRAEYYDVLHAADLPRSGWDGVEARDRPAPDRIRLVPERSGHILDGDADGPGGGHRHGTGRPGKTEFPASWDDRKVLDTVLDVARQPDQPPARQERNGRWIARGTREDVEIVVIVARDGRVWTAWPLAGGPGVVKNPEEA